MPAPRKYTVGSAVRNKEHVTLTIQRRDMMGRFRRWVCSCGAHGQWFDTRHSTTRPIVGDKGKGSKSGGWWGHVVRIHGSEYE